MGCRQGAANESRHGEHCVDASVVTVYSPADWLAMELTYRRTRDDILQFAKLIRERVALSAAGLQGRKRTAVFTGYLAVVLLTLAVLASGIIDHIFWIAGIAYFGGFCSMYLFAKLLQRRYFANLLTDDSSFLSESRVTLDADGVVCFEANKTTRYSWRAFSDVTEQAGLIVLWRDRGQGLAVPARVLANDDARRDFVTLVRERIAQAAAP